MVEPNLFLLFTRRLSMIGARYMVSGSVAVIIYGEPRLTHDVDLVVILDQEQVGRLSDAFPVDEFYCPPEEVVRVEAAREQRGHFNLIHHATGFKADVYLAGRDELHEWAFARTRSYEVEGEVLVVAPPEYVIIRKLEYFREGGSEKHLRDVRSMLDTSPDLVDRTVLDELVSARGLEQAWRRAAAFRG